MKNSSYNLALYYTFCDYLILSKDIEKEIEMYKNIILNDEFMPYFLGVIDTINETGGYPAIAINNIKKIITFLEENSINDTDKIKNIDVNSIIVSNNKYYNEIKMKENSILAFNQNIKWKEQDVVKSLKYDFLTILSLKVDSETYTQVYMPHFILNKDYIYSINKIAYMFPYILSEPIFKQRIENILNTNKKILENKDEETIKLYLSQNSINTNKKYKYYISDLNCIEEENNNTLMGINNNLKLFNINDMKIYHNFLAIQSYLNECNDKIDYVNLKDIYNYIDNIVSISKIEKDRLINLLNSKKDNLNTNELNIYNEYLVKANSLPLNSSNKQIDEFLKRGSILDYFKVLHEGFHGDKEQFENISQSYKHDLYIYEVLLMNEKDYDTYSLSLNSTMILHSLKKFMNEYPGLFSNCIVHDRVLNILKKYQNEELGRRLNRKIKKIKKV